MKSKKNKFNIIVRLTLIYTALLMFLAVNNRSFTTIKPAIKIEQKQQEIKKSNAQEDTSEETIIQEISVQAVVPLANIHLHQALYLIFSLDFPVIEEINFNTSEPKPILSYFENTFENHIAIHAP